MEDCSIFGYHFRLLPLILRVSRLLLSLVAILPWYLCVFKEMQSTFFDGIDFEGELSFNSDDISDELAFAYANNISIDCILIDEEHIFA